MMSDRFWAYFIGANMGVVLSYMVVMHYQQCTKLNEVLVRLERVEAMLRQDIEQQLVDDQRELLQHCLDYSLTSDTGNK